MPYASNRQSRFIHAKASEGVGWAKKFVADSHGTHVPKGGPMNRRQQNTTERVRKSRQPYRESNPSLGPRSPQLLSAGFGPGGAGYPKGKPPIRNGHNPAKSEPAYNNLPGKGEFGALPLMNDEGFKGPLTQQGGEGSLEKNIQGQAESFAARRRRERQEARWKRNHPEQQKGSGYGFGHGSTKA